MPLGMQHRQPKAKRACAGRCSVSGHSSRRAPIPSWPPGAAVSRSSVAFGPDPLPMRLGQAHSKIPPPGTRHRSKSSNDRSVHSPLRTEAGRTEPQSQPKIERQAASHKRSRRSPLPEIRSQVAATRPRDWPVGARGGDHRGGRRMATCRLPRQRGARRRGAGRLRRRVPAGGRRATTTGVAWAWRWCGPNGKRRCPWQLAPAAVLRLCAPRNYAILRKAQKANWRSLATVFRPSPCMNVTTTHTVRNISTAYL